MRHYSKVDITVMQLIAIMPTYGYDLNKTLGDVLGFTQKNAGVLLLSAHALERLAVLERTEPHRQSPIILRVPRSRTGSAS